MESTEKKDKDARDEGEFFIGGWDPYVVEITKLKREKHKTPGRRSGDKKKQPRDH